MPFFPLAVLLPLVLSLSACSVLPKSNDQDVVQDEEHRLYYNNPKLPREPSTLKARPFPADTLYALLLAEIAGQRQQYDVALHEYLQQAEQTQDSAVAERALRIAQFVGDKKQALQALNLWLEQNPDTPIAHQAAAVLYLETDNIDQALVHLKKVQQLSGQSQYDYLAANAGELSRAQQQQLLDAFLAMQKTDAKNGSLLLAIALMYQHLKDYPNALTQIDNVLSLHPYLLSAGLQKARILVLLGQHQNALLWLAELHKHHPNHKGIQVLNARILLELNRMDDALAAFRELNQQFPEDTSILLSLALLNQETGHIEAARDAFYQLLANGEHTNEAHFYLGRIADDEGDSTAAINHFSQVGAGREFIPAQLRAATLIQQTLGLQATADFFVQQRETYPQFQADLVRIEVEILNEAQRYKAALELLGHALEQEPDNLELLYSRAMTAERAGKLKLMEQDLRTILRHHPDNVDALNALGYTLADRTERWSEALPLIQRAFDLAPNNPAIIDSLGWLYFRMGETEKARPLLEDAFKQIPDHEIAAHLGELLWVTGDKFRAIDIWQQGLKQRPNSSVIHNTLKRLQINLDEFNPAP